MIIAVTGTANEEKKYYEARIPVKNITEAIEAMLLHNELDREIFGAPFTDVGAFLEEKMGYHTEVCSKPPKDGYADLEISIPDGTMIWRRYSTPELRKLCEKNDWMKNTTPRQQRILFRLNDSGASLDEIASYIWLAGSSMTKDAILRTLKEKGAEDSGGAAYNQVKPAPI